MKYLRFREKGSRPLRRRILFLALVFLLAVIFFYFVFNFHRPQLADKVSRPSLPMVAMTYEGETVNYLHGYKEQMDASYMRGDVTPVGDDNQLSLSVITYGKTLRSA